MPQNSDMRANWRAQDLGPVRREYPAALSSEQLGAVAKHFLTNRQSVWRPDPDGDGRSGYYPPTDVVYETCFEEEIADTKASEMRRVFGIGEDDTLHVLWDRKASSFFKTTHESFVICDSGIYYRTAKMSGHMGWEELRSLPAAAIMGQERGPLSFNGITFTLCRDGAALMLMLQKVRNELIYARCWPRRDELTFEVPAPQAGHAHAYGVAEQYLKGRSLGRIVHTMAEHSSDDASYADDVRRYLDIPADDVIYVGYEWQEDGCYDTPFSERTEFGVSPGAFACTQRGLYVLVDDGENGSHTRLIGWDEYVEVMLREFVEAPDGRLSLLMGNWLYGNLDEGYNLYGELFCKLHEVLKSS